MNAYSTRKRSGEHNNLEIRLLMFENGVSPADIAEYLDKTKKSVNAALHRKLTPENIEIYTEAIKAISEKKPLQIVHNMDVRREMLKSNIGYHELSEYMNLHKCTLSTKMHRRELTAKEKKEVFEAIENIKKGIENPPDKLEKLYLSIAKLFWNCKSLYAREMKPTFKEFSEITKTVNLDVLAKLLFKICITGNQEERQTARTLLNEVLEVIDLEKRLNHHTERSAEA